MLDVYCLLNVQLMYCIQFCSTLNHLTQTVRNSGDTILKLYFYQYRYMNYEMQTCVFIILNVFLYHL